MTQFSIPVSTTSNSERQDIDSSWELRMAKLVGFEPEVIPNQIEASTEATPTVDESPQTNPHARQPLSSNPFAKAGLVGATTLLIVVGAGTLLSRIMVGTSEKPKDTVVTKQEEKLPVIKEPLPEAEIELLKTKLALADQAKAVKAAQIQLKTAQAVPSVQPKVNTSQVQSIEKPRVIIQRVPVAARTEAPRIVVQKVPGPVQTVYVPRIVTVERIVKAPQVTATPQQRQSPQLKVIPSPVTTPAKTTPLPVLASDVRIPPIPQATPAPTVTNNSNFPPVLTTPPEPENSPTPQRTQQTSKSVAVGTSAKAVLANGLFGETTKSSNDENTNDSQFVVRLQQPIKNADNTIALPAGTELLTQIRRIGESGMVQLDVVSVISLENGNVKENKLPKGALKIRSPQGKPLIASKFPNKGGAIASMDSGLFVLGGISKAAELANRPESSVNINGTSVITQTNPRPNILTGVLEGGLTTIVPQITVRNQQAISEMTTRSNIWVIPVGKVVEVYVNQTTQF